MFKYDKEFALIRSNTIPPSWEDTEVGEDGQRRRYDHEYVNYDDFQFIGKRILPVHNATRVFSIPYQYPTRVDYPAQFGEGYMSLRFLPGNYAATYTTATDPKDSVSGFVASKFSKSTNYLVFGLTSSPMQISTFNDLRNLNSPTDADNKGYAFTVKYGESVSLLLGVGCKEPNLFPNVYDLSKIRATSLKDATYVDGVFTSGTVMGTLSDSVSDPIGSFKLWRISFTPQEISALGTDAYSVGFRTASNVVEPLQNMSLLKATTLSKSVNSVENYIIADSSTFPDLNTDSQNVAVLRFTTVPNPYAWCWQKVLPDTTFRTFTVGTVPNTSSSLSLGTVANASTIATNIQIRNTSNVSYVITSVVVTVLTPSMAMLTNSSALFVKNGVASDFSVSFDGTAIASCTANNLATTKSCDITLGSLDAVRFNVRCAPTVKVVATPAMIVPYNVTTAPGIANAINNNRKIKIQLLGYQVGMAQTAIPLGDALTLSFAVI